MASTLAACLLYVRAAPQGTSCLHIKTQALAIACTACANRLAVQASFSCRSFQVHISSHDACMYLMALTYRSADHCLTCPLAARHPQVVEFLCVYHHGLSSLIKCLPSQPEALFATVSWFLLIMNSLMTQPVNSLRLYLFILVWPSEPCLPFHHKLGIDGMLFSSPDSITQWTVPILFSLHTPVLDIK